MLCSNTSATKMTHFRHEGPGSARQVRGTVPRGRHPRPRRLPRAPRTPRTSPSAIRLALAPAAPSPHSGRDSKTRQGVCADCWASKEGRQFWIRKTDQGWPLQLSPTALGAVLAVLPTVLVVLLWILG